MLKTTKLFARQCCKCKKFEHKGEWQTTNPNPELAITHTYCRDCCDKEIEKLAEIQKEIQDV